jgi:cytochrome c-type biogenesis protein
MTEFNAMQWVLLPIGLGLFGFIEPCSIGASLLFIKSVEGKTIGEKLAQVIVFAVIRAVVMGLLGVVAVVLGAMFLGLQKVAWTTFGVVYTVIGIFYLLGKSALFQPMIGPHLSRFKSMKGSVALGLLFAFNIPACAAPLLIGLLGMLAATGASGASYVHGFVGMALFGFALSLPILVVTVFPRTRKALDWLGSLSRRLPRWTGILLIVLGLWSIYFGLFVTMR